MNESGPVKRPIKTSEGAQDFSELTRIAPNVWRATRDGKYWLLKTARAQDSASLVLLRREYELSCNLQHPFIAPTFAFLEDSPVGPAILREYIEGATLRDFVASEPSKSVRSKILGQILAAVEYIHQKGLLHNDIKPENILVSAIGNDVRIIDFGLAENDSDYLNRRLGGTAGSTAPEVLSETGDGRSTAASDIYAIGGLLQLLFPGKYGRIVRKCLRREPEERYRDIAALRRAIIRANRRPVISVAVIMMVLIVCVAMLPYYVQKRQRQREEERVSALVRKIQNDLTAIYQPAADSIANRLLVPKLHDAYSVRGTFVKNYASYRESLTNQEQRFVCDTVYGRLVVQLSEQMRDLPVL